MKAAHPIERRRQLPDFVSRLHDDFLLQLTARYLTSGFGHRAQRARQRPRQR